MTIWELEKAIDLYGSGVYSFCKRLCLNADAADELYQEVWLKAMQNISGIDTEGNVKSYLISVAIGIWRNDKKQYAVRNRIAPQEPVAEQVAEIAETESDTLADILRKEQKAAVLAAVNNLTDKYRLPVLLYYMEEKSIREIADDLHIPEGTVKRRLWSARGILKKGLEEYINE